MIDVVVVLEGDELRRLRSAGHSGDGPRGSDLPCAAVSVLVRTAARMLAAREGVGISAFALEPGLVDLEVVAVDAASREWLAGVTAYLVAGLTDVARDFPSHLSVQVTAPAGAVGRGVEAREEEIEGEIHGS